MLGTSAVGPLYASLTARLMNIYGVVKVQNLTENGGFYKLLSFHDITSCSNGDYSASICWDPVTGMGSFENYSVSSIDITTNTAYSLFTSSSSSASTTTSTSNSCFMSMFFLNNLKN